MFLDLLLGNISVVETSRQKLQMLAKLQGLLVELFNFYIKRLNDLFVEISPHKEDNFDIVSKTHLQK